MNINNFIRDLIPIMNDRCNKCHTFGSIIENRATLDDFNLTDENKCCNIIFIESYKIQTGFKPELIGADERLMKAYCDHVFNILILEASRADLQFHNETQFHEISQSRWSEYIQPKIDCFACDFEFDICQILGDEYYLTKWNVLPERNVSANFFDGIRIETIIRQYGS